MTEPVQASPPADEGAENDEAPQQQPPETNDDVEPSHNSEAARYRVERNEARAERDALVERLSAYQRRECEATVADLLDVPGDLFEVGQANIADFYDDDGTLDEGELRAAAGALCDMRPKLAKPKGPTHQNFGQYAPPPWGHGGAVWSDVLKG